LTGLDPIQKESGSSVKYKSRISKAGSNVYRASLFMSVLVAVRFNNEMKIFYERLKNNGKHTTTAQIAVMRKLIVIAFSLYQHNEKYNPTKYAKMNGSFT
jgi:transposase